MGMLLMSQLPVSMADMLAYVQCDEDPVGYIIPDPTYCDRYLDCDPVTGPSIQLCPPGQSLDLQSGTCQAETKVDCSNRKLRKQQQVKTRPLSVEKVLTRGGPGQRQHPTTTEATTTTVATTVANTRPKLNLFGSRRRQNVLAGSRHINVAKSVLDSAHRTSTELPSTTSSPARGRNKAQTNLETIDDPSDPMDDQECEGTEEYVVPDPTHCDRYMSCPEEDVLLCKTGTVLDLNTGYCQREGLVDCEGRELLYRDEVEAKLTAKVRKIEEETKEIIASTKVSKKVPENKFPRLKVSRPGSSDRNNPSRPLVLAKEAIRRKPLSPFSPRTTSHTTRKTTPPPRKTTPPPPSSE